MTTVNFLMCLGLGTLVLIAGWAGYKIRGLVDSHR